MKRYQTVACALLISLAQVPQAQEASTALDHVRTDTSAIAQAMDAKNTAIMSILQAVTKCQAKLKFYKPGAGADADGCVSPNTTPVTLRKTHEQEYCVYGTCGTASPSRATATKRWTLPTADICMVSGVSGYAGGLWGQCKITGAPGTVWTLTGSQAGNSIVSCNVVCLQAN